MPEIESQPRYPMERLDANIRQWFLDAQNDANRRGGQYLTTGLILTAAARSKTVFAERLLATLGLRSSAQLEEIFDAEWASSRPFFHDEPVTAVKESILRSADEEEASRLVNPEVFVATMFEFPTGMASKMVKRLGLDPSDVSRRLRTSSTSDP